MSVRSGRRAKPQAHVPKPLLANIHAAAAALLVVNSIVLKVVNERVPASYMVRVCMYTWCKWGLVHNVPEYSLGCCTLASHWTCDACMRPIAIYIAG